MKKYFCLVFPPPEGEGNNETSEKETKDLFSLDTASPLIRYAETVFKLISCYQICLSRFFTKLSKSKI